MLQTGINWEFCYGSMWEVVEFNKLIVNNENLENQNRRSNEEENQPASLYY